MDREGLEWLSFNGPDPPGTGEEERVGIDEPEWGSFSSKGSKMVLVTACGAASCGLITKSFPDPKDVSLGKNREGSICCSEGIGLWIKAADDVAEVTGS